MSNFPITRLRRLRRNAALRKLFEETVLDAADLVFPLFVVEGHRQKQTIDSMPGIYRYSVDLLPAEAERIAGLGIGAVILFGLPSRKDPLGTEAYNPQGAVQQAVKALKASVPQLVVINDVCLCEYTDHGHCGVLSGSEVDNDKTLEILSRTALSYAEAGSDMVAPSDMMDGRVQAIRRTLDTQGFSSLPIMAYSQVRLGFL
jgi:porphobilinogen synthase